MDIGWAGRFAGFIDLPKDSGAYRRWPVQGASGDSILRGLWSAVVLADIVRITTAEIVPELLAVHSGLVMAGHVADAGLCFLFQRHISRRLMPGAGIHSRRQIGA